MKKMPKHGKIRIADEEHSRFIQNILFRLGYQWCGDKDTFKHLNEHFLFFDEGGYLSYAASGEEYFINHTSKEIFTQDLLLFPEPLLIFKLNDTYNANVDCEKRIISVGCQRIDVNTFVELYKLLETNNLVKK